MSDDVFNFVRVADIRLLNTAATVLPWAPVVLQRGAHGGMPDTQLQLSVSHEASAALANTQIVATVKLVVEGTFQQAARTALLSTKPPDEVAALVNDVVLRLSASYLAVYDFDRDEPPTTDELMMLANSTCVFNVWPFFREQLHGTTLKMGLTTPLLPSLKPDLEMYLRPEDAATTPD